MLDFSNATFRGTAKIDDKRYGKLWTKWSDGEANWAKLSGSRGRECVGPSDEPPKTQLQGFTVLVEVYAIINLGCSVHLVPGADQAGSGLVPSGRGTDHSRAVDPIHEIK